jgi:hypothetical protein
LAHADVTLTLRGDNGEAQNAFGSWLRVAYQCTFDPDTKTVVNPTMDSAEYKIEDFWR